MKAKIKAELTIGVQNDGTFVNLLMVEMAGEIVDVERLPSEVSPFYQYRSKFIPRFKWKAEWLEFPKQYVHKRQIFEELWDNKGPVMRLPKKGERYVYNFFAQQAHFDHKSNKAEMTQILQLAEEFVSNDPSPKKVRHAVVVEALESAKRAENNNGEFTDHLGNCILCKGFMEADGCGDCPLADFDYVSYFVAKGLQKIVLLRQGISLLVKWLEESNELVEGKNEWLVPISKEYDIPYDVVEDLYSRHPENFDDYLELYLQERAKFYRSIA